MKYRVLDGEDEFLEMLLADPGDEMARQIYADWLESMGDLRAEWIRLECEFHCVATKPFHHRYRPLRKKLRGIFARIDPEWGRAVTRDPYAIADWTMWGDAPPWSESTPDEFEALLDDESTTERPTGLLGRFRGLFGQRPT